MSAFADDRTGLVNTDRRVKLSVAQEKKDKRTNYMCLKIQTYTCKNTH